MMIKKILLLVFSIFQLIELNAQVNLTVSAPLNNGSNTGVRAPNGTSAQTTLRAHLIIPASELVTIANGTVIDEVGFLINTGAVGTASGTLQIYLENTSDVINLKSTTWTTAITGMASVYNGSYTIPTVAGPIDFTLSSGFTYTGGGLYVAYDYVGTSFATTAATYLANNTLLASCFTGETNNSTSAATLSSPASAFRPEIRFTFVNPNTNDLAVNFLESDKGKINSLLQSGTTVNTSVTNNSSTALTNVPVTINITGANPYTTSYMIASINAGATEDITFSSIPIINTGSQTIQVSVPPDNQLINNSLSVPQDVFCDTLSYTDRDTITGGVGYSTGSGILANRYVLPSGLPLYANTVGVTLTPGTNNTNNIIKGVLMNSSGVIVDSTNSYTIQTADLGQKVNLNFINGAIDFTGQEIYIGFRQTANSTGYFPCATQPSSVILDSAFYGFGINGGAGTIYTTLGSFMIDAVINTGAANLTTNTFGNTMCLGSMLSLTAAPLGFDVYEFNVDGGIPQTGSLTSYSYSPTATTTAYFTVTKNACSFVSNTEIIDVVSEIIDSIDIAICDNESHLFDGQNLTVAGLYIDTLVSVGGCDSIVRLDLMVNPTDAVILDETICQGTSYNFSGQNLTVAGTYGFTTMNALGCDSTTTLNLVVLENDSTINETICSGETYVLGTQNLMSSGTYYHQFTASNGCDSIVMLNLSVETIDASVGQVNITLTALTTATNATYQWFDCLTNTIILGETNASYTPTAVAGEYAVIVSQNGCADTSDCFLIDHSSIEGNDFYNFIQMYPNPVLNELNINVGDLDMLNYTVYDVEGRVILSNKLNTNSNGIKIDTRLLETGSYIIELNFETGSAKKLFIKN